MRAKLIVDGIDLLNEDIAITAKDHIDDHPNFDSNPSQRKLDISTDNVLDAASAAPMTVSTISKRHRDAICEKLFHCQEDQRVQDSIANESIIIIPRRRIQYSSILPRSSGEYVGDNLGRRRNITEMMNGHIFDTNNSTFCSVNGAEDL